MLTNKWKIYNQTRKKTHFLVICHISKTGPVSQMKQFEIEKKQSQRKYINVETPQDKAKQPIFYFL